VPATKDPFVHSQSTVASLLIAARYFVRYLCFYDRRTGGHCAFG
jgi:hypothetical protein